MNYNHISHVHCWDNKDNPCGIPLEKHTRCCLCDMQYAMSPGCISNKSKEMSSLKTLQEQLEEFDEKFTMEFVIGDRCSDFVEKGVPTKWHLNNKRLENWIKPLLISSHIATLEAVQEWAESNKERRHIDFRCGKHCSGRGDPDEHDLHVAEEHSINGIVTNLTSPR